MRHIKQNGSEADVTKRAVRDILLNREKRDYTPLPKCFTLAEYKTTKLDKTIKRQPKPADASIFSLNMRYPIDNPKINLVYLNGVMVETSPMRIAEINDP